VAKYVSGGMKISTMVQQADGTYKYVEQPPIYDIIDSRILGDNIAVVTLVFLACLWVSWIVLARLQPGRYVFAIGGSEESARLSGVPVGMVKVLSYGMCGLFSAVAGICHAAQEYQGDPEAGVAYELKAIAIVVIGGTNLMGGRGSVLLTLVGTLTIGYLEKILSINAVGEASRLMLTGVIIVTAVLLQRGKGADLGASLGGGGANTIFGSRGAGNFLTKMTTASAIIFMCTSLTLSYLGYQASDVRLFDQAEPFEAPGEAGAPPAAEDGGLEEIPAAMDESTGGLVEIEDQAADPTPESPESPKNCR